MNIEQSRLGADELDTEACGLNVRDAVMEKIFTVDNTGQVITSPEPGNKLQMGYMSIMRTDLWGTPLSLDFGGYFFVCFFVQSFPFMNFLAVQCFDHFLSESFSILIQLTGIDDFELKFLRIRMVGRSLHEAMLQVRRRRGRWGTRPRRGRGTGTSSGSRWTSSRSRTNV